MIKVIVINGAGTSGKDTFIDLFTTVCRDFGSYKVHRFSSVDSVKYYAARMGWDGVKDDKGRRFLSDIKDAMTRYNDAPFNYMKQMLDGVISLNEDAFVFFHVREPVEIQKMVERLGAITILVERPSVDPDSFTNHADKDVEGYKYDYHVVNDGSLFDLRDKALGVFNSIIR